MNPVSLPLSTARTAPRRTAGLKPVFRPIVGGALGAALLLGALSGAQAHAVLERKEAVAGSGYRGTVQIMHGCDGRPTTRVSVTIPEGMIGAKPMPKPGWTVTTARGAYDRPYQSFHGTVSEGVKTITWSGGEIPDEAVDEFTFFARVADTLQPGATLYVPVEQDCAQGGYRWSEIPAAGQSPRDLKSPAPALRVAAAQVAEAKGADTKPAAPAGAKAAVKAGDLTIETPWLRATPAGAKVAGGYVRITNTGSSPDTLTAAAIPLASRGDIHTMSTENGVMKMAPLPDGLTIKPGETVELKPGGLHLMFEGLTGAPKAGESLQGSLTFARAGTVPVTFTVAPIGATSPGVASPGATAPAPAGSMGGGHHHH